jgi:hypothetical protein
LAYGYRRAVCEKRGMLDKGKKKSIAARVFHVLHPGSVASAKMIILVTTIP